MPQFNADDTIAISEAEQAFLAYIADRPIPTHIPVTAAYLASIVLCGDLFRALLATPEGQEAARSLYALLCVSELSTPATRLLIDKLEWMARIYGVDLALHYQQIGT